MELQNEYRHILKGSEEFISKGAILCQSISLPPGYTFSDALMYQIGTGETPVSKAIEYANELKLHYS